jgi:hypothetical protein
MPELSLPERVILAFGGLTKAAEAIEAPITTVDSWRAKGTIPRWRIEAIRKAAEKAAVALPDDFPKSEAA